MIVIYSADELWSGIAMLVIHIKPLDINNVFQDSLLKIQYCNVTRYVAGDTFILLCFNGLVRDVSRFVMRVIYI